MNKSLKIHREEKGEKMTKEHNYDIALFERPGTTGLTREEADTLYCLLHEKEAYPFEVGDINGNSTAMGFIATTAAEKLQYEYCQESELGRFISEILDDMEKETDDHTYKFKGLKIWMSR